MTIALGIIAEDGLVIAADTQETYSGLFKMDQGKILGTWIGPTAEPSGFLSVSGAGTAGHLDAINQQLCNDVGGLEKPSFQGLEKAIKTTVRDFNIEHIAPFSTWQPEYDRPSCSLVIAAALGKRYALWTSDKSTIKQGLYGAVGIGAPHANLMLGRLWRANLSLDVATRLAAYVMFWVKQNVDGCGKDTQMVLHQDGKAWICEVTRTELMEQQFARYMELEELAARYVIGMGPATPVGGVKNQQRQLRIIRAEAAHVFKNFNVNLTESDYKRSRIPLWSRERDEAPKPQRSGRKRPRG